MFNVKSRKLVLTLFCSLALVLVLTDSASANPQLDAHRMLRKRSPQVAGRDNLADIIQVGTQDSGTDPNSPSGSVSSVSIPLPTSSPSSAVSHSPSPSSALPLSSSSLSSSSSSSLSSLSSSSSSSSSSTTQPPSTPTQQNDTPTFTPTTSQSRVQQTEFMTVTSSDTGSTSAVPATSSGASSTTKTTLTVLIALAGSVGGVVIIWTVIRKWKFKPSDKFEDRMQPIDWQPTGPEDAVPGLIRTASTHSHASFYSGGHESDHNSSQHGGSIRRAVTPLPEHDFTPGPSHLAPGGGYADLARGPSPQPQMTQMHEAQYGVPLHHQGAYDSQGTVNGQRY